MSYEKITALLVDDEQLSLNHSRAALETFLTGSQIHTASTAQEAIQELNNPNINLAFLDIEMADTSGFSLAEYIHEMNPELAIVFLTGHVELGAKSYEYESFDFLTKPVDTMRLRKTLNRFEAQLEKRRQLQTMDTLRADSSVNPESSSETNEAGSAAEERIAVDTGSGLVLLSPSEIEYISKEGRKTVIHTALENYTVQYSLEEMETIFEEYGLFRTHQSFLVPLSQISTVKPSRLGKTYSVLLQSGAEVPMSRGQYAKLRGELVVRGIRVL